MKFFSTCVLATLAMSASSAPILEARTPGQYSLQVLSSPRSPVDKTYIRMGGTTSSNPVMAMVDQPSLASKFTARPGAESGTYELYSADSSLASDQALGLVKASAGMWKLTVSPSNDFAAIESAQWRKWKMHKDTSGTLLGYQLDNGLNGQWIAMPKGSMSAAPKQFDYYFQETGTSTAGVGMIQTPIKVNIKLVASTDVM